jgi:hypothetical protein
MAGLTVQDVVFVADPKSANVFKVKRGPVEIEIQRSRVQWTIEMQVFDTVDYTPCDDGKCPKGIDFKSMKEGEIDLCAKSCPYLESDLVPVVNCFVVGDRGESLEELRKYLVSQVRDDQDALDFLRLDWVIDGERLPAGDVPLLAELFP